MKINKEISFDVDGLEWNEGLVHQVAISKQSELRSATSQQKTRSDVRGGGRKPWKQKGTGRARAGTIRSPLWKGGGVTFASKNRNYVKKINKKMYAKAVQCVLFRLQEINAIEFIDDFVLSRTSTKDALVQLKGLFDYNKKNKILIVDSGLDENKILSFRNAVNVDIITTQSLGILQLLNCDKAIITEQAHAILNKKYLTSEA